jgi:hypothetical protein
MKKPKELSFRKTAAAVGRLNNSLPLFPSATAADKFSDDEIVELLEWSIPQAWRTKFDLDGYIPTEHTKARLITECEILERNDPQKPKRFSPRTKKNPLKKALLSLKMAVSTPPIKRQTTTVPSMVQILLTTRILAIRLKTNPKDR